MIDENSPLPSDPNPSDYPAPKDDGLPSDSSAPQGLLLTPDQLDALGLSGLAPGTTCTISLKATDGAADGGQSFDVLSATPDDGTESPTPVPGESAPVNEEGGDTLPPSATPETALPDTSGPDDELLGFSRPKKTPRVGLPDTKNMRNL